MIQPINQMVAQPTVKPSQTAYIKQSKSLGTSDNTAKEQTKVSEPQEKKPYIPSTNPVVLDNSAAIERLNKAMYNSFLYENIAIIQANKKANQRTK